MMDSAVVVPRGGGGGRRGARTAVRSSEGVVDVDAMVVDDPAPTSTATSTTSSRLVSSNRRDVEVDLEHQSNPTIEASTALNMLVDSTLASTAKESDTSTSTTSKRTRVTGTKRPAPTTTPPTAAATTVPAAGGSGGATEEVMVVKRGRGRPRKDGLPNRSATLVPIASLSKPKPKPPAKASTPAPPNDTDEDEGDAADDGTYDENLVERDTPSSTTTRASRVRGSKAAELAASTTLLKWMASSSDSSSSSSSTSATSATPTTASKAPTATDIPILPNCMPLLSNLTLVRYPQRHHRPRPNAVDSHLGMHVMSLIVSLDLEQYRGGVGFLAFDGRVASVPLHRLERRRAARAIRLDATQPIRHAAQCRWPSQRSGMGASVTCCRRLARLRRDRSQQHDDPLSSAGQAVPLSQHAADLAVRYQRSVRERPRLIASLVDRTITRNSPWILCV